MNNLKRFGALVCAVLLVVLYLTTLILALMGSEQMMNMLKASIFLTFFIPVMLYTYIFIYKLIHKEK